MKPVRVYWYGMLVVPSKLTTRCYWYGTTVVQSKLTRFVLPLLKRFDTWLYRGSLRCNHTKNV